MANINFQFQEILANQISPQAYRSQDAVISIKKSKNQSSYKNSSGDDQFEPDYHTMKKLKFPINRKRLSKGNWTLSENKIYLDFLINNRHSFADEATRRQERVFCKLSQLLRKKRTPDQCRSHHQKLLANLNNSIDDLIAKIQRKIKIKELKQSNNEHKVEKQYISPLKIQEEKIISTVQPSHGNQFGSKRIVQNRQVEKIIERDFYLIKTYKRTTFVMIQIDAKQIEIY